MTKISLVTQAMHTHLSVTQRDLAKETEECRKLASTIEMIKEERSASIQKATISLQEKENELASKVKVSILDFFIC